MLHVFRRNRPPSQPKIADRHCWEGKSGENGEGQRGFDRNDRGSEEEEGDVGVGALLLVVVAGDEKETQREREMNKGGCEVEERKMVRLFGRGRMNEEGRKEGGKI